MQIKKAYCQSKYGWNPNQNLRMPLLAALPAPGIPKAERSVPNASRNRRFNADQTTTGKKRALIQRLTKDPARVFDAHALA
jgi:hypothetical protein